MAGPSNEYKKKLINLANKLNLNDTIYWTNDHLTNYLKWGAILNSKQCY